MAVMAPHLASLGDVENIIQSKFRSDAQLLEEISSYLFSLGGKRVRPALALLTARAFGMSEPMAAHQKGQQLLEVAAGMELIHMGTLLHDDIIDKSPLRRHHESPLVKYGEYNTLLAGDFLLVRAFGVCSNLDPFIVQSAESACIALTEGEILETSLCNQEHSIASCLEIARKKTAALFKFATQSAAYLAGANQAVLHQMSLFGERLGIAFQILDDILDVTSSENMLGKRSGQDLRERKPSLVNVLWLQSGSALARELLRGPGPKESIFVARALRELRASPVIERAKQLAHRFAGEASQALDAAIKSSSVPVDKTSAEALYNFVDYIVKRVS